MNAPRYLLDLDILLRVARAPSPRFARRLRDLQPGDVAISVITYGELLRVAPNAHRLQDALPVVALTANAAEGYARLRDRAARCPSAVGMNRLWLAAHALHLGATLVTVRSGEFGPTEGPVIENWLAH